MAAKLSAKAALESSGSLPENVNYAIKSSFLLGFLESMPDASNLLKEPETAARKTDDIISLARDATALLLVY